MLKAALHRLADPPGGVRRELEAAPVVELLDGADQAEDPLLDQVEERQPQAPVALRVRHDEPQVRLDHPILGALVASLDPLGQLDLLDGGEQRALRDVAQEELQRIARGLGDRGRVDRSRRLVGAARGVEHLDATALGLGVERIEGAFLQIELLDGSGDLAELEGAVVLSLLEQRVERGVSGKTRHAA